MGRIAGLILDLEAKLKNTIKNRSLGIESTPYSVALASLTSAFIFCTFAGSQTVWQTSKLKTSKHLQFLKPKEN